MNTTLMESNVQANAAAETGEQYSLGKILGIWASVALPMGLILWVLMPILIPRVNMHPGFLFLNLITLGLIWQGVAAYIIGIIPFAYIVQRKQNIYIGMIAHVLFNILDLIDGITLTLN